jgi:diguanylate cyclase (GGDEF)-like protein
MYQNCMLLPVRDAAGKPEAVVVILLDATDTAIAQGMLQDAMAKLADSSSRDGLTGVHNRRYLENHLASEYDRARRYGTHFSVAMFDLDHFKHVNDTYGHLGGDAVLVDVSRRVVELLRSSDMCGRYGGEEFAVVLPETNLEGARQFGERLRTFIAQVPVDFDGQEIPVTCSIGVTQFDPGMGSYHMLIHQADLALYASKTGGRNRVTCYTPELEKIAVSK